MPEEICLSQYEKQIAWDQFPFSLIYLGGYVALVTSSWGSIFVFPDILVPPQVVGTARTGDQFSFSLIYLRSFRALVSNSWGSILVFPDILVNDVG